MHHIFVVKEECPFPWESRQSDKRNDDDVVTVAMSLLKYQLKYQHHTNECP